MRDPLEWEPEDPEDSIAIGPPVIPRDDFEVCEGLRETTLAWIAGLRDNEAIRRVGQLLFSVTGVQGAPKVSLRDHALAGLVDLRHIQGIIQLSGEYYTDSILEPPEELFSRRCERFAKDIRKIADRLAETLDAPPPPFKAGSPRDRGGFRETTLVRISNPEDQRILRRAGSLLWGMILEHRGSGPAEPEGWLRHEVRAAVADLRHLQGHFHKLGRKQERATLKDTEVAIPAFCRRFSGTLQRLADKLEQELDSWRGLAIGR